MCGHSRVQTNPWGDRFGHGSRVRATPNRKTHHSTALHRQKQPGAPRKGKEQREKRTSREHSSTRQQNTTKTAQKDPAQHRAGKQGARTQPNTRRPHSTRQNTQHTTDRSTTGHDALQRTTQSTTTSRGGGGSTISTQPRTKGAKHAGEAGVGRTKPNGTLQRNKTPNERDQHHTHQRKAKQHYKPRRNSATPPPHPGARTAGKRRRTRPDKEAPKQGTRGARGRETPPARRHGTCARRQATTNRGQAPVGSTE